eukprot:6483587-Amphidinium_carterae.1
MKKLIGSHVGGSALHLAARIWCAFGEVPDGRDLCRIVHNILKPVVPVNAHGVETPHLEGYEGESGVTRFPELFDSSEPYCALERCAPLARLVVGVARGVRKVDATACQS